MAADRSGHCTTGLDRVWSRIGAVAPGRTLAIELTADDFGLTGPAGGCELFP